MAGTRSARWNCWSLRGRLTRIGGLLNRGKYPMLVFHSKFKGVSVRGCFNVVVYSRESSKARNISCAPTVFDLVQQKTSHTTPEVSNSSVRAIFWETQSLSPVSICVSCTVFTIRVLPFFSESQFVFRNLISTVLSCWDG